MEIGVTALFASLATLGIIFTIACLIFNFKFRNTKYIILEGLEGGRERAKVVLHLLGGLLYMLMVLVF